MMGSVSASTVLLLAALVLAVWRWRHWKSRACARREELAALREALYALAYESSNAVNAIRAHLGDFRQANPSPAMPEHLEQIAVGADRIARMVRVADDPVAWYRDREESRRKAARAGVQPTAPVIGDLPQG